MASDTTFFIVFALVGFFVLAVVSIFIKKMFVNFSKEMLNPQTDAELLHVTSAISHTKAKANRLVFTVMSVLFGCVGIGGLVMGSFAYHKTNQFVASAEQTDGKIVGIEVQHAKSGTGRNQSTSYYPRFTFQTKSGEPIEVLSSTGVSNVSTYSRGEIIPILYDPSRPMDAKINTFFQIWASTIIFFAVSMAFLLFPLGYGVYRFISRKKQIV